MEKLYEHEFLIVKDTNLSGKRYFSFNLYQISHSPYLIVKRMGISDDFFSCIYKVFSNIKTYSPWLDGSDAAVTKGLNRFEITQFDYEASKEIIKQCKLSIEEYEDAPAATIVLKGDESYIQEENIIMTMQKKDVVLFWNKLYKMAQYFCDKKEDLYFIHLGV